MRFFSALTRKITALTKRRFLRDVSILAGSTATAQLISVISSPLLTRLYGPEAYGVQGVFMTCVALISTVAALSYPAAIVLPTSDTEAVGLCKLAIALGALASLLSIPLFIFFGPSILTALQARGIADYSFLVPPAVFFSVLNTVMAAWMVRKREFSATAKVGVLVAVVTVGAKVFYGLTSPTAIALILVNVITGILATALLYLVWRAPLGRNPIGVTSIPVTRLALLRQYSDFALLRTPQALLATLGSGIPIFFLAAQAGPSAAGFYVIATTLLGMPAAVIGGSVTQVLYPRLNDAAQAGQSIFPLLLKSTLAMVAAGTAPLLLFTTLAPSLFSAVFGPDWFGAGSYAQWLSIGAFFTFIARPSMSALAVIRLQELLLLHEVVSIAAKAGSLYLALKIFDSDIAAVAAFSIATAASNLALLLYTFYRCSVYKVPK